MSRDNDEALLASLLDEAKRAGADAADALIVHSTSLSHAQRLGEIERLERSESDDLGLRVIIGRRQAVVSSTDLKSDALKELVKRAVAMAEAVPEDPYCGLAQSDEIIREIPDLDIFDAEEPAPETLIERAKAAENAAMGVPGITNSEGAEAEWGEAVVTMAASNGFSGSYQRSSHSLAVAVLGGSGVEMERDYDFTSAVYGSDLRDPSEVGRTAADRTVKRLNPRRPKTGRYPVVFDFRIAGAFPRYLASAINGAAIARGTSFLKDRMDEAIFAPGITITDDPHRPRGLRSKPFDAEGLANEKRKVIDQGTLTTWLLDLSTARQLGLQSTGHAARGTGGPPSPSATNLFMEPGALSRAALIGEINQGLLVTETMGMGVNLITGDYSQGAAGFWIEGGEIAYPVSGLTVAGNLKEMFKAMTPADDLVLRTGVDAPTLRIDGMTVAGE